MLEDINEENLGESYGDEHVSHGFGPPSRRTLKRQNAEPNVYTSKGLSEIARYGGYSVYQPKGNTDPWVRHSLKLFDRDLYDSLYGFTRRGEGTEGMYKGLYKFSKPYTKYTQLQPNQRAAMKSAIHRAREAFKLPVKHEPLDWHEVGQYVRTDTSAGASFMGKIKSECMPQIYTEARWLGHRMKEGGKDRFNPKMVRFPPCLAGMRGHMSPRDEPKTRLVWVYPAEMLVVEGLWAPVMYREFEKIPDSPLLYGKSAQRLFTEWAVHLRDGEKLHGLDFSSFDTTVPPWLIHVAFDILHQNVDWYHWRGRPTSKRTRQKWRNVWDGCKWYFINTPILMPDGRMFRKNHGVPSGSWFTQLIDSVVNYILVDYLSNCQGLKAKGLKVLGDDSAFRNGLPLDVEVAGSDALAVGMELSDLKCEVTTNPNDFKLLGVRYRRAHAWRKDEEWFKLALYPENPPNSAGVSLSRLVGLWLGGAMWSMHFSRFLEFFQTCYECPSEGWFSKDQRRWLEIVYGGKSPRGWTTKKSLFWKSIFYTM